MKTMSALPTSSPDPTSPVAANPANQIQVARIASEQAARKAGGATLSEWDQVGNCSGLDQVKAATPKPAAQR
ncbi:hypothetical protein [Variovorax sp. GT1P44]|uniref:hypothetical protein n=1 Tax=Variovorax sp. GT1P44 TaxID=3443742 RepID=UPI003F45EB97